VPSCAARRSSSAGSTASRISKSPAHRAAARRRESSTSSRSSSRRDASGLSAHVGRVSEGACVSGGCPRQVRRLDRMRDKSAMLRGRTRRPQPQLHRERPLPLVWATRSSSRRSSWSLAKNCVSKPGPGRCASSSASTSFSDRSRGEQPERTPHSLAHALAARRSARGPRATRRGSLHTACACSLLAPRRP